MFEAKPSGGRGRAFDLLSFWREWSNRLRESAKKGSTRSTLFYASNVSLAGKSPWQSLAAHHRRQALLPLGAPVHSAMGGFRLTGCSACSISLIFASLLIRLGISATAALDSIEFAACREMLALVTTGQMSIDSEMDNHRTPP